MLVFVTIAVAALAGCSTYSDGTPIDWSGLTEAVEKANASAPKNTVCTPVGNQVFCRTQ